MYHSLIAQSIWPYTYARRYKRRDQETKHTDSRDIVIEMSIANFYRFFVPKTFCLRPS